MSGQPRNRSVGMNWQFICLFPPTIYTSLYSYVLSTVLRKSKLLFIYIFICCDREKKQTLLSSEYSLSVFFPYHCKRNNQIYIYTCTHIHIYSINKIKIYVEGIFFALFLWRTQCSGHGLLCTGVDGEPTTVKESKRHKLIQQSLMLSSEYHTHPVKTKKGKLQCAR